MGEQKINYSDAFNFVRSVKEAYKDKPEVYDSFLELLKRYRAERIDPSGVKLEVEKLFEGEQELLVGFNKFLPERFRDKVD